MPARILVIEDERDIRDMIDLMLNGTDYTVVGARDAFQGMNRLREDGADLIILDIMMPGMSGWEMCRQLKADPATRDIPVVILTVPNPHRDAEAFPASGAAAYINKPFTRKTLLATIARFLPAVTK
jgi:CheY-like chemotaxis protein